MHWSWNMAADHSMYTPKTMAVQWMVSFVKVYEAQLSKLGSHRHLEATRSP